MEKGRVIWFNPKGWGFIAWEKDGAVQPDMFVHYSGINQEGYRIVKAGDEVMFEVGSNHNGRPIAVQVTKVEK